MPKERTLTVKQELFANKVVELGDAAKAYRASYNTKATDQVIYSEASKLMRHPLISVRITELRKRTANKLEITRERVLLEYARIAFGDIRNLFDDKGNLINPKDMNDDIAAAVISVEVSHEKTLTAKGADDDTGEATNITEVTVTRKVKLADKTKALDALGRHLGLFKPDHLDNPEDFAFENTTNNRLALARKLAFIFTQGLAALDSGQIIDHKPKEPVKPE